MTTKHTPLPWKLHELDDTRICNVRQEISDCDPIAITYGAASDRKANAAFIVRAVNSHDDLVAALKELLTCSPATSSPAVYEHAVIKAQAALAKAKGE